MEVNEEAGIIASFYNNINREVARGDDLLIVGGAVGRNDRCRAAVGDVDDVGVLGEVAVGLGNLLGSEADAYVLLRLNFSSLASLWVLPHEGDVDSLDVVDGYLAFGDRVDLIDNRRCGNRSYDKLGALGQRALGSGHVDGHAVAVLGREGNGRVLDLFVLLLLVGVLFVGLILVVGVGAGFVALVA